MIEVRPFKGVRYNPNKIKDSSLVVCPPYDIINDTQRNNLYNLHPNNFVRIDFDRPEPGDTGPESVYPRARSFLDTWIKEGILIQDETPSIYIYQQDFTVPVTGEQKTRTGFIASLKLEDFEKGNVRPHEYTFSGPKKDRMDLMTSLEAVTGQVFMLYPDAGSEVRSLLAKITTQPPLVSAQMDGIKHRLWRAAEAAWIKDLCSQMQSKWLIIADGHHRYETALGYRDKRRAESGNPKSEQPWDRVMMSFVALQDAGLVILPIHRLIKDRKSIGWSKIKSSLMANFDLEPAADAPVQNILVELKKRGQAGTTFYLKRKGEEAYWVKAKPGAKGPQDPKRSEQWNRLDVSVLQTQILNGIFQFSETEIQKREGIECLKDPKESVDVLDTTDSYDYLFLMNPVGMEELESIVGTGERMPQKSTNFHPKIYSGFVAQKFDHA